MTLNINGKAVAGKTIVQGGQVYVPLSSLKASGAVTSASGKTLSLKWPAGGSNEQMALEGGINEWLFDGIWRFRVTSVVPLTDDRPGWKVNVELRNGSKANQLALDGSGFEAVDLVMLDGNKLTAYNQIEFANPGINQAAGISVGLIFFDDDGSGRLPDKLIVRIRPDQSTRDYLKRSGATYTVGDPSFRIRLISVK